MRTNANLFWILGAFFLLSAAAYTIWVGITVGWNPDHLEWVGTVAMTLSAILAFFLAFYLGRTHSAQGGELAQDSLTADIDDDDPELGHFSPWSWWPLTLGGALALVFLGLAVGPWISFIGGPLAVIAIIGWNYEYYRNNFAR
ncbi:cytochrome c oxidase subunit 4 [Protaetiibacter mangrovi]|uniref:Cytochrome c oxidase polypeptide 4 n=1 Tax=Protaetiibacter mangrovi TaxID=2970926 RepID=A0ABT1ZCC4_9MICO|nr:cytochrome c oxidase subunit 4 [Protaetiibacter mangrovi]MCS0498348.1 cytochrome c oxidase subunit 4 [Protaetiibacter mangrovi]